VITVTDPLGNHITLSRPAQRIVSLVPSQTELLSDLGLNSEVVGITKFCIYPDSWFRSKTRVGGTKNIHIDKIRALQPDLIIANKEENTRQDIERLQQEFPVYVSHINTLNDALTMMHDIGILCGKINEAQQLITQITQSINSLTQSHTDFPVKKVVYLIWKNPFIAAGQDTFITEMLRIAGFENAVQQLRYPQLSADEINQLNPDYLFLSSEPYPFNEKHRNELNSLFPKEKLILVDGELFSWYGSRLLHAKDYFEQLRNSLQE